MIRKSILLLLVVAGVNGLALAQRMTDMVWDTHGIGFKVPSNFKIETNNAEEFIAGNDDLHLVMGPIQDENIGEGELAAAVIAMAKELEYDELSDVDEIKVSDFVGYYIEGSKDGAKAVVMAVLDTESSTNLLLVLVYTDETRDKAIEMVHSIYAYDK
jgi:hypothetical protein